MFISHRRRARAVEREKISRCKGPGAENMRLRKGQRDRGMNEAGLQPQNTQPAKPRSDLAPQAVGSHGEVISFSWQMYLPARLGLPELGARPHEASSSLHLAQNLHGVGRKM